MSLRRKKEKKRCELDDRCFRVLVWCVPEKVFSWISFRYGTYLFGILLLGLDAYITYLFAMRLTFIETKVNVDNDQHATVIHDPRVENTPLLLAFTVAAGTWWLVDILILLATISHNMALVFVCGSLLLVRLPFVVADIVVICFACSHSGACIWLVTPNIISIFVIFVAQYARCMIWSYGRDIAVEQELKKYREECMERAISGLSTSSPPPPRDVHYLAPEEERGSSLGPLKRQTRSFEPESLEPVARVSKETRTTSKSSEDLDKKSGSLRRSWKKHKDSKSKHSKSESNESGHGSEGILSSFHSNPMSHTQTNTSGSSVSSRQTVIVNIREEIGERDHQSESKANAPHEGVTVGETSSNIRKSEPDQNSKLKIPSSFDKATDTKDVHFPSGTRDSRNVVIREKESFVGQRETRQSSDKRVNLPKDASDKTGYSTEMKTDSIRSTNQPTQFLEIPNRSSVSKETINKLPKETGSKRNTRTSQIEHKPEQRRTTSILKSTIRVSQNNPTSQNKIYGHRDTDSDSPNTKPSKDETVKGSGQRSIGSLHQSTSKGTPEVGGQEANDKNSSKTQGRESTNKSTEQSKDSDKKSMSRNEDQKPSNKSSYGVPHLQQVNYVSHAVRLSGANVNSGGNESGRPSIAEKISHRQQENQQKFRVKDYSNASRKESINKPTKQNITMENKRMSRNQDLMHQQMKRVSLQGHLSQPKLTSDNHQTRKSSIVENNYQKQIVKQSQMTHSNHHTAPRAGSSMSGASKQNIANPRRSSEFPPKRGTVVRKLADAAERRDERGQNRFLSSIHASSDVIEEMKDLGTPSEGRSGRSSKGSG